MAQTGSEDESVAIVSAVMDNFDTARFLNKQKENYRISTASTIIDIITSCLTTIEQEDYDLLLPISNQL